MALNTSCRFAPYLAHMRAAHLDPETAHSCHTHFPEVYFVVVPRMPRTMYIYIDRNLCYNDIVMLNYSELHVTTSLLLQELTSYTGELNVVRFIGLQNPKLLAGLSLWKASNNQN